MEEKERLKMIPYEIFESQNKELEKLRKDLIEVREALHRVYQEQYKEGFTNGVLSAKVQLHKAFKKTIEEIEF